MAGKIANITFRAVFNGVDGSKIFRNTGGANLTLELIYLPQPPDYKPVSERVHQQAVDTNDGFYHMYYVPKYAGRHALHIRLFGEDVTGSPYEPLVEAGVIEASNCVARDFAQQDTSIDGGLSKGSAGVEYNFEVVCRDQFGNLATKASSAHWKTKDKPFMVKFAAIDLYWGSIEIEEKGTFKVSYTINTAGLYETHIQYRTTPTTYVSIQGSPYNTSITKVLCPVVGDPEPCNGQGKCQDNGVCKCNSGWDGDYCQVDLAKWLRIGIVLENAVLLTLVIMFFFNLFWKRCVRDKQMFERLKHDDEEEAW